MITSFYQVDAFTDKVFGGNPAGVCLLDGPGDSTWMQKVANEMNLSETAFLYFDEDHYNLRWFTPAVEVDLCGHATLASAHILYELSHLSRTCQAEFMTRSGELFAGWDDGSIAIDLPAVPTEECDQPKGLLEALDVKARFIGKGAQHYLVEALIEEDVLKATPDFSALLKYVDRPVILTSRSDSPERDIVSRFFGPTIGIDEDPVTGFAHCCLAPYWGNRLGTSSIRAYQASTRGGELILKIEGNRILLTGKAVTVFRIEMLTE
jgi:PhzF family phenazine biosynthesis protein